MSRVFDSTKGSNGPPAFELASVSLNLSTLAPLLSRVAFLSSASASVRVPALISCVSELSELLTFVYHLRFLL